MQNLDLYFYELSSNQLFQMFRVNVSEFRYKFEGLATSFASLLTEEKYFL